eukprot:1148251-Pelagomonas_calceolata.AAC.11
MQARPQQCIRCAEEEDVHPPWRQAVPFVFPQGYLDPRTDVAFLFKGAEQHTRPRSRGSEGAQSAQIAQAAVVITAVCSEGTTHQEGQWLIGLGLHRDVEHVLRLFLWGSTSHMGGQRVGEGVRQVAHSCMLCFVQGVGGSGSPSTHRSVSVGAGMQGGLHAGWQHALHVGSPYLQLVLVDVLLQVSMSTRGGVSSGHPGDKASEWHR